MRAFIAIELDREIKSAIDTLVRGLYAPRAGRVAVYTHRDPAQLLAQWAGERIHNVADIPIFAFDRGQIEEIAARLERRSKLPLSITEREMYVQLDGWTCQMDITEHRVP